MCFERKAESTVLVDSFGTIPFQPFASRAEAVHSVLAPEGIILARVGSPRRSFELARRMTKTTEISELFSLANELRNKVELGLPCFGA
jgi:hypothetical protein